MQIVLLECIFPWELYSNFLEEVSASYEKLDASKIYPEKRLEIHSPGIAPPYLFDSEKDFYLAQMPAILIHLGRKFDHLLRCT